MDVVFVIDSSGSIGQANFQKMVRYVAEAVRGFKDGTSVGVVTYSSGANVTVRMSRKSASVLAKIASISYTGGGTDTAAGIKTGRALLMQGEKNKMKVMVVLTDGESDSSSKTTEEASATKLEGVRVYAIGIGAGPSQKEIKSIASFPNTRYAHSIDDFASSSFDRDILTLLDGKLESKILCAGPDFANALLWQRTRYLM